MDDLLRLLECIESHIDNSTPPASLREALVYETHNLYTYTALEIAKQKLTNQLLSSTMEKIVLVKKLLVKAEEFKDCEEDDESRELLQEFYGT